MNFVKVDLRKYHLDALNVDKQTSLMNKITKNNVFVVRVRPDVKLKRELYRKVRSRGYVEKHTGLKYALMTKDEFLRYYSNVKIPVFCKFLIIPISAFEKSPFRLNRKNK